MDGKTSFSIIDGLSSEDREFAFAGSGLNQATLTFPASPKPAASNPEAST